MSERPSGAAAASERLVSLDALRGFDMLWIVGGGGLIEAANKISDGGLIRVIAHQMHHKEWEGFAFEDLIFPLFVFIVGISIVLSLGRILERHGRAGAVRRIVSRAIVLYLLGLITYGGISKGWGNVRLL